MGHQLPACCLLQQQAARLHKAQMLSIWDVQVVLQLS